MNCAFKMMVVVFSVGILALQGCQTTNSRNLAILNQTNEKICQFAVIKNDNNVLVWDNKRFPNHVREAKFRKLSCKVSNEKINKLASNNNKLNYLKSKNIKPDKINNIFFNNLKSKSDLVICSVVSKNIKTEGGRLYLKESKRRGLDCRIKDKKTQIFINKNKKNNIDITTSTCALMPSIMSCRFLRKSGIELCETINGFKKGVETYDNYSGSLKEVKRRGLDCGVKDTNKTVIASKTNMETYTKAITSSAELNAERQKRIELERKLVALETKQKQQQQKINADNEQPKINAFTKQDGANAIISGRVTDNTEVADVLLDGAQVSLANNGTFETELYVPRDGLNVEIVAFDKKGNKAIEILQLERSAVAQAGGPSFDRLNPSTKKVKLNPNALALIIGISDYEKTPANALYADKDAQQFYDYATMKLGVPSANIKELVNDKADLGEILINLKDWLRRSAKPNKSDIYIFFAGHGLASQDGTKMYLLPYDGRPRLLENTALLRDELFKDIKQANPRTVTVFLDTCYSGITRNKEMLIAARPIVLLAKEQAIPDGFTLFSAASNEQISRPLKEAKHGMFSYFLMKGMEGDADSNNDNKITARELHVFVEQNVVQQSSGLQTPELKGDKDRVLVTFN